MATLAAEIKPMVQLGSIGLACHQSAARLLPPPDTGMLLWHGPNVLRSMIILTTHPYAGAAIVVG
jgi:hypothetical protein